MAATIALLRSFQARGFALGTVYSKTEVIQVAIVGALVLGEPLRPLGWVAIVVCMVGVAWLASNGDLGAILRRAGDPAARLRSEEHTSELQSLMRISYAVFCL